MPLPGPAHCLDESLARDRNTRLASSAKDEGGPLLRPLAGYLFKATRESGTLE